MSDTKRYVVGSDMITGHDGIAKFWSNELGWLDGVDIDKATRYTEGEMVNTSRWDLPNDGCNIFWVLVVR